jgi:hypothetical protein
VTKTAILKLLQGVAASAVFGLILIAGGRLGAQASSSCLDCTPGLLGNPNMSGSFTVCLESGSTYAFSQTQYDAIESGLHYWDSYFQDAEIDISFSVIGRNPSCSGSGADIVIKLVDTNTDMVNVGALAEANQTSYGYGATIKVNEAQLTNSAVDWAEMAAHEMGHLLGFDDINPPLSCSGLSVMWHQNVAMPSGGATCSDKTAASGKFVGGNNDPGPEWFPEGDCWEVWTVYRYWWFDGTDYHFSGWFLGTYQYTDCDGGPPI